MSAAAAAQPFRRRLTPTADDLHRMAWAPSYRAPRAADLAILNAPAFPEVPVRSPAEAAILSDIARQPSNDDLRLAYAAWCDRNGDPRSEFIRTQLAIHELQTNNQPIPPELRDHEEDLIAAERVRWEQDLAPWCARDIELERGLPTAISLTGRAFLSLGEPLFERLPLTGLRLVAFQHLAEQVADCPRLGRLRSLDFSGCPMTSAALTAWSRSPHLQRLTELHLARTRLGDGLHELAQAPWFGRLQSLTLRENGIQNLDALAVHRHWQSLDLSGNDVGACLADRLPQWPELRSLNLASTNLTVSSLTAFPNRLDELDVSHNGLSSADLSGFPADSLRLLSLRGCGISMETLATMPTTWPRLESLDLGSNPLGDDAIELLTPQNFPQLRELNLMNCGLTDRGIGDLLDSGVLKNVRRLTLSWNRIGERMLERVWNGYHLRKLEVEGISLSEIARRRFAARRVVSAASF